MANQLPIHWFGTTTSQLLLNSKIVNSGSGGSAEPTSPTVTDNRKSMPYWYQPLTYYFNPYVLISFDEIYTSEEAYSDGEEPVSLDSLPEWALSMPKGTAGITNFQYMFRVYTYNPDWGVDFPVSFPAKFLNGELDMTSATTMFEVFRELPRVVTIRVKNTGKVTDWTAAFEHNYAVKSIGELDMRSATKATGWLMGCKNLKTLTLKNVKISLNLAEVSSQWWGHGESYTKESLIQNISELIDMGEIRTLTIRDININKISDVYVKLIEVTDAMRAEDEFIDAKYPFEECASTDAGAMNILDYVLLKNWALA